MNQPSREDIEVRLTALLLGELPDDEAQLLRYTLSQDAALKQLHDELAQTIVLVREAAKTPAEAPAEKTAPLKLAEERREKLLAHFKTPRKPDPLFWLKRIEMPGLIPVLVCIALVTLVAAMLLPALSKAKNKSAHLAMLNGKRAAEMTASKEPAANSPVGITEAEVSAATGPIPLPQAAPIYLPPNQAAVSVATASDSLADAGSQSSQNAGAAAPQAPNLFAQNGVVAQPMATGGGGGGGGGGLGADKSKNGFASDESGATHSRTENKAFTWSGELARRAPAGSAGTAFGFQLESPNSAVAIPTAPPALALNEKLEENSVDRNFIGQTDGTLQNRDGDNRSANLFYRNQAAETSANKAPSLGDVPVAGRSFLGPVAPSAMPASVPPAGEMAFKKTDAAKLADNSSGSDLAVAVAKDSFKTGADKGAFQALRKLTETDQVVAGKVAKSLDALLEDKPLPKKPVSTVVPQPEFLARENNFSTFSLNVSDVSFKLAAASLERGQMPDAASIRSEEFINAFDYRDPEAAAGQPLAFTAERARYPFEQNRDLLRFSIKTAAAGRAADRPLNLVLLLDDSGSMERADRVAIIREALRVLATQLHPADTVSVVTFARTARLWADGVSGDTAGAVLARVGEITPEGGTNLEEALRLAYETARRHYLANGMNRVVLLTDGAANLGNVSAAALKKNVEAQRRQGIALDCFGIGWEDYNDTLLEELSGNGDGRYAFLNSPEDAAKDFAAKLAGALQVAAQDVKVQVEFNPQRVISWRQIGYAKHQLTKEQFRDNSVIAAEIAAQEAGNALYTIETKADGAGPISTVRVRYKIPGSTDYREHSWDVAYTGNSPALEQSSAAMRLAAVAAAFSEWLSESPFAQQIELDDLLKILRGVPKIYGPDERPKKLERMIQEAKNLSPG